MKKKNEDGHLETKVCKLSISDIIQCIIALFTLISVIAVFISLHEAKVARNATYKPYIVMNPIDISIKWNTEGYQSWLTEQWSNVGKDPTIEENEDGGKLTIPMTFIMKDAVSEYTVVNIGVGTAKNITFSWDEGNLSRLKNALIGIDDKYIDFFEEQDFQDCFQFEYSLLFTNKIQNSSLMYMLPEATEPWTLFFPTQYRIMIEELIKQPTFDQESFPLLIMKITYDDIQGKSYEQHVLVRVFRTFYSNKEDGSGEATYQLTPIYSVNE